MMKPYPVQLEISGPTALWTRPDTGSSPVSYVAPTFSAVKGIFESVLRCAPFRPETRVCEIENHELPTMLRMVFDQMQSGVNRN